MPERSDCPVQQEQTLQDGNLEVRIEAQGNGTTQQLQGKETRETPRSW
ncbi:MAG: hypothetical protein ACC613_03775 [Synergistales bacterium]|jgi:hypothetical protein